MKENEDYLDDLLKTLGEEEKDSFDDEGFNLSDLMDNTDMENTFTPESSEEIKRPLSTLEQLMAEMESESDDSFLENIKNTDDSLYEDNISYESADDVDMSEIEALLNMSDNNEIVDEDEAFMKALNSMNQVENDFSNEDYPEPEGEILELDPAELDALLSSGRESVEDDTKNSGAPISVSRDSHIPEEDINSDEISDSKKKKKIKKDKKEGNGLFHKLFSLLMEEYPEEEEPKEAGSLNLSEENKEILTQLDKEKGKKKKKDKKGKKEKGGKQDKTKKPEKPKKEKKPKVKKEKPKKEKLPEKPEKRLPKKKVIVTFVFAFSILVAILLLEFIVPPMFSLTAAREAFEQGDYKTAYLEYYGKKLSEEDELKFQGITTIMRMQSNLDGYHNYLSIDEEVMAVHSLLEGVNVRTDIFMKAEAYGVTSEVNRIYDEILNLLSSNYGLSESDAIAITEIQSDVTYTNELNSIVGGNFESVEYEEEAVEDIIEEVITEEVVEEYLLPEELEMLQGGE